MKYYTSRCLLRALSYFPESFIETIAGLDPDFWSKRTRTLGLTRVKGNPVFGSDQSSSLAQLLVQKIENWIPHW